MAPVSTSAAQQPDDSCGAQGLAEYLNLVLERCSDDQCLVLAKFLHVNKHIHGSAAVTPSEPTSSHPSSIASNAPSPFVTRPSPLGQTPHGPSPGSWGAASGPTPPAQAGGEHTAERRRVERAPRGAHGAQGLTPSCSEKVGRIGGGDATTGATAGVGLFFVQAQGGFGACEVDEVIPGSSADEQGSIRVGDVLTAVDSRDIRGLSLAQVRDAIVGQPGSLVTLTLNRPAHGTFSVTLARAVRRPSPRIRAAAPDASAGGLSGPESIVDAFLKAGGNTSAAQRAHARAAAAERTQAAGNWVRRAENVQPVKVSAKDQKGLHMAELFPVGGAGATPESGGGGRDEDERRGGDVDLVVALCDFVAARPHELSLRSGDVLLVKRRHTSGWWECEHPTGTRGAGWVPSNHVRPAETGEGNEGGGAGAGQASDLSHEMSRELAGRGVSSGDGPSASKDLGNVFVGSGSAGSRGGAASPPPDNAGGDAPTARMSVDEVCAWLETLELGEYCERFRANKIDGELLLSLEERDLEEDFAMENKYHRRRLLRKLHP